MREDTATTQGTTLEILAPYLPYGIWIEHELPSGGFERGEWTGFERHRTRCLEMEFADGSTLKYKPSEVLPILRPFAALVEPLPDGTVPAVEVAKLLTDGEPDEYTFEVSKHEYGGGFTVLCSINEELVYQLDLRANWDWWLSDLLATANHEEITVKAPAKVIGYLRRHHFAVGLEPHQYIPKSPAPATIQEGKSDE